MILFLGLVPIRASATEGVSGYFKYSIDVTFDNEPYSYSQYIKCVKARLPKQILEHVAFQVLAYAWP